MRAQRKLPQPPQATILTGADLRAHRTRLGISQAELARRLNYDASYVCHMERGDRRVTPRLATALLALVAQLDEERRHLSTLNSTLLRHGAQG